MRAFELRILDGFKSFSLAEGRGKAKARKGLWIKGHLSDVEVDYVYGMWAAWCKFVEEAEGYGAKIHKGTYGGFKTYIWLLKRFGLIVKVGEDEATKRRLFSRSYYTLNPEKIDSPY